MPAKTLVRYFLTLFFLFVVQPLFAETTAIEAYGLLPKYRSLSISPNGERYAFIRREGVKDYMVVADAQTAKPQAAVDVSHFKARDVAFISDDYVLIYGSITSRANAVGAPLEITGVLAYNLASGKIKTLLRGTRNLYPIQIGLGLIVGFDAKKEQVFMPAHDEDLRYNLYRVSLKTGRGQVYAKGSKSTRNWFLDHQGQVLAREEYSEKNREYRILSKLSGEWKSVYSKTDTAPLVGPQAVSADGKKLISLGQNQHKELFSISLEDGSLTGPLTDVAGVDIEAVHTDINRSFLGVEYSGFVTRYDFEDKKHLALFERLNSTFPNGDVRYVSATDDWKKIIIKVSGGGHAGNFFLFDTESVKLSKLLSEYPAVVGVGEQKAIRYKARDGLDITAVVTYPTDETKRKNLPLIALPHGGPAAYDRFGFDWLAQYLASKGYLVLQPNFRGSTGFGLDFREAGNGEWGRKMQDDVSDGVQTLVQSGQADPQRVCIMGGSYGGYSALAGGAFSADLYRCVVAINGVTDIPTMLGDARLRLGTSHWVIDYWNRLTGGEQKGHDWLKDISPSHFADRFQAPVLLIHGKDDSVVPFGQSQRMLKRLKKAKKPVELVTLKGEDHWLSTSATRLKTLQAIDRFLQQHNPP
ncbi:alpha/beta hydrolase family protein [Porticoccus sp. GXU_MW_L64]